MNTDRHNTGTAPRAIALVFALFVTLATLAGIDRLATGESAGAQWAQTQAAPAQG